VIIAMGGIGSFLGALAARPLVRRFGFGRTIVAALTISVAAGALIPLAGGPRWLAIGMLGTHQLVGDCFAVVWTIHAVSLRQMVLPKHVLGRANAAIQVVSAGMIPITAVAAGVLAQLTTIRFAVWVGIAFSLVMPIALWPLRTVNSLSDEQLRTP
jgi:MFS family permease